MKCLTIVTIICALLGIMFGCSTEPEIHHVTFDSNGGSTVPSVTVADGGGIEKPQDPTKQGFSFKGWYRQNDYQHEWNFSTDVVTADMTLYAKWVKAYMVTFEPQGGASPIPPTKEIVFDEPYGTLPEVTRTGYRFIGWMSAQEGGSTVGAETICDRAENHTLYANWEAERFKVTLNPQGGTTPNPTTIYVYFDKPYGAFSKTTRTGYRFFRWTDGEGSVVDELTICERAEDHTLYAEWGAPLPFEGEAGGMVFYENPYYEKDGWRYLEAAPDGWSGEGADPEVIFGYYRLNPNEEEVATGADGREIGEGLSNTQTLYNKMGETAYTTGAPHHYITTTTNDYAARICRMLSLSHGEKNSSDWFLPSKEELGKLYRYAGDGYESGEYWSSTEFSKSSAFTVSFSGGSHQTAPRSDKCYIRPIRKY